MYSYLELRVSNNGRTMKRVGEHTHNSKEETFKNIPTLIMRIF